MPRIAFACSIDDGYLLPALVCLSSLLRTAKAEVCYDIFILHSGDRLSAESKRQLQSLAESYPKSQFNFLDLGQSFKDAFEIRGITITAYYHLLLPQLFKGRYEQVIHSDVDIVFRADISELVELVGDAPIAGVREHNKFVLEDCLALGLKPEQYINSGLVVYNLPKIKDYSQELSQLIGKAFKYQDQDIINLLFQGAIRELDLCYNYTIASQQHSLAIKRLPKVVHYNGSKPWRSLVGFDDLWWQAYRESPCYDEETYTEMMIRREATAHRLRRISHYLKRYKIIEGYKRIKKLLSRGN